MQIKPKLQKNVPANNFHLKVAQTASAESIKDTMAPTIFMASLLLSMAACTTATINMKGVTRITIHGHQE